MTKLQNGQAPGSSYILVVEDDSVVQLVLGKMLERAGYKVDFADDGSEAIGALELKDYDLVVMDCVMPQMDGFAVTRFIRSGESNAIDAGIPIIAMTGLSTPEDISMCHEAGMNSFLNKPVVASELTSAIEHYLGKTVSYESVQPQNDVTGDGFWDDAFLDTMIEKFLAEVPQVQIELQQAGKQRDLTRLWQLGHRLRGVADILGTTTLSARACALEQAGKSGDIKLVGKLTLELTEELQKMTTVLTD